MNEFEITVAIEPLTVVRAIMKKTELSEDVIRLVCRRLLEDDNVQLRPDEPAINHLDDINATISMLKDVEFRSAYLEEEGIVEKNHICEEHVDLFLISVENEEQDEWNAIGHTPRCTICQENEMTEPVRLGCKNVSCIYCKSCIIAWITTDATCPNCKFALM